MVSQELPTYVRNDSFVSQITRISHSDPVFPTAGGSREHYFHFLLGYLLPIIHAQEAKRFDKFRVLDCGPLMTPILTETLMRLGYHFSITPMLLTRNPVFVEPWDVHWENTAAVLRVVSKVSDAWNIYDCVSGCCPSSYESKNLLLVRSAPHAYYQTDKAEIKNYGTDRREILNYSEIVSRLIEAGIVFSLYEPGAHCLGCQIQSFGRARNIFGMRGAEWANVIFARNAIRACYLDHMPPAVRLTQLFERLGVSHHCIPVAMSKPVVDPSLVSNFFGIS